jgi:hypothetical protein
MEVPIGCVLRGDTLVCGSHAVRDGQQIAKNFHTIDAFGDCTVVSDGCHCDGKYYRGAEGTVCCSEYVIDHGKHLTMDGCPYEGMLDVDMQVTTRGSFDMPNLKIILTPEACVVIWHGGLRPPKTPNTAQSFMHTFRICGEHRVKILLALTHNGTQHVVGLMTPDKITWYTEDAFSHECTNPCNSVDVDVRWRGGWWSITKVVEARHMKSWITASLDVYGNMDVANKAIPTRDAHYIATDIPFGQHEMACKDFWLPSIGEVVMMDYRLPIELHAIIGEYAGLTNRALNCRHEFMRYRGHAAGDRGESPSIMHVEYWKNTLYVGTVESTPNDCGRSRCNLLIEDATCYSAFENHVVVRCGGRIMILDLDDMDRPHTRLRISDDGELSCSHGMFCLGFHRYSYAAYNELAEVDEHDDCRDFDYDTNVGFGHHMYGYVMDEYQLGRCGDEKRGDLCDSTCITFSPIDIHVKVPAFGRCKLRAMLRGTRVAIVMTGAQGYHFQIHDVPPHNGIVNLDGTTLLMCANDYAMKCTDKAKVVFFGNGVCVETTEGWAFPMFT